MDYIVIVLLFGDVFSDKGFLELEVRQSHIVTKNIKESTIKKQ